MSKHSTFDRLVAFFKTQAKFAEAMGVTPQALGKWRKQIPAERVLEIEKVTGGHITRFEMRPDVFGTEPTQVA